MGLALRPTPGTRASFFKGWAIPTNLEGAYALLEKSPEPVVLALTNPGLLSESLMIMQTNEDIERANASPGVQFGWIFLENLKRFSVGWSPEELDELLK